LKASEKVGNRELVCSVDAQSLSLNSVTFHFDISSSMRTRESTKDSFLLAKTPELINQLLRQTSGKQVERIFDIGIFKGGSVALYNELFSPKKLVAIENGSIPVSPLAHYITSRSLDSVLRPYYGVDQADSIALEKIYQDEFDLALLDLVIDDASHFYNETKASFNTLFPRVRPGGIYVIEDWGWNHWPNESWGDANNIFLGRKPLSDLVFEIARVCATSLESVVKQITICGSVVYVERGYGSVKPGWDVSTAYVNHDANNRASR
jgi:SAM-dependent methyltransferase